MPTKQPPAKDVRMAPAERVFALPDQGVTKGEVVITRDVGLIGSGCFLGIFVDGTEAARLDPSEQVRFQLSAGRHVLTPRYIGGNGLCGAFYSEKAATARARSAEITVDAGQSRRYRIHTNTDNEPTIEPVL
ncbi:hypothetical protein P6166_04505 [Stenotrophomonas sp. HITSZ_GD]|uniref:hypothetical protein n=1 Tax=Stenotrophomonas sp. HITSZ_GD TaxID=3037248 RepID=UPI00240D4F33|nr:hypothetical protein [Stenotrophomonas sp. HITSZ_GD]MDG2524618.1 hypothetical protein [Stenotrophomonas sp. HITSZ_GD]